MDKPGLLYLETWTKFKLKYFHSFFLNTLCVIEDNYTDAESNLCKILMKYIYKQRDESKMLIKMRNWESNWEMILSHWKWHFGM